MRRTNIGRTNFRQDQIQVILNLTTSINFHNFNRFSQFQPVCDIMFPKGVRSLGVAGVSVSQNHELHYSHHLLSDQHLAMSRNINIVTTFPTKTCKSIFPIRQELSSEASKKAHRALHGAKPFVIVIMAVLAIIMISMMFQNNLRMVTPWRSIEQLYAP